MSGSSLLSDRDSTKVLNREPFGPDTAIFKEGDRGKKAYVVARGTDDIVTQGIDGKLKKLTSFKEGEMFGEMSLLNGEKKGRRTQLLKRVVKFWSSSRRFSKKSWTPQTLLSSSG